MTKRDSSDSRSLPVTFIGDQSRVVADASVLPEACRKLESSNHIQGDTDRSCDERSCSRWCTYWENPCGKAPESKDSTPTEVVKEEEVPHSGLKHHSVQVVDMEKDEDDARVEKDREEESAGVEEEEEEEEVEEEEVEKEKKEPEETAEAWKPVEKDAKQSAAAATQILGPLNIIAAAIPVDWCACPEGACAACDRFHDGCGGGRSDGEQSDERVSCSQNFEIVIEYSDESQEDAEGQATVVNKQQQQKQQQQQQQQQKQQQKQQQCGGARKRKTANSSKTCGRNPRKRKK